MIGKRFAVQHKYIFFNEMGSGLAWVQQLMFEKKTYHLYAPVPGTIPD